MFRLGAGLLIVAVLLTAALFYSQQNAAPFHVSGFVEADEIRLGSRVGGRVSVVHVEEGDEVAAGEVLVELAPFDLLEKRAQAAAILEQQQAQRRKLEAGLRPAEVAQARLRFDQLSAQYQMLENGPREQEIRVAAAELDSAKADLVLAQVDHERLTSLLAQSAAAQDQVDMATRQLKAAQARVQSRSEQLNLLKEGTRKEQLEAGRAQRDEAEQGWILAREGYRKEDIAAAVAAATSAEAALAAIDQQIDELRIVAPVAGAVEAIELRPGDLVSANAPVAALLDHERLWIRAYVPENRLDVSIGQKVRVTVDSYPSESFEGVVTFIARQAEFTPGNVQTPEERSKQVFRIKVTLPAGDGRLRPGMAADVWFDRTANQSEADRDV